jgi:lipoyl(octanoyl) transferase
LIDSDRGGKITYHGPGQFIFYLLLDLRRLGLGVRDLIHLMERSVVEFLHEHKIASMIKAGAPGVYIAESKVASIGIRIVKGCSYHGLSVNVDMDLTPFNFINPCGYADLSVTQFKDIGIPIGTEEVWPQLIEHLTRQLCYQNVILGEETIPLLEVHV